MPVRYYINVSGTADCPNEFTAVQNGFQAWENIADAWIEFNYQGTTADNQVAQNGQNTVFWGYLDPEVVAAVYTWQSGSDPYRTQEQDMVFNDYYNWDTSGSPAGDEMDVQNVAAHEAGHFVRLRDLYGGGDTEKTMYGVIDFAETQKRTLEADDITGCRFIYTQFITTSGALPYDQTWCSDFSGPSISVTGSVTVPSSKTLRVWHSTTINFTGSYKLHVDGTLYLMGTQSRPVTFGRSGGGTWFGIELYNVQTHSLSHAVFNNMNYGVWIQNTTVNFSNCTAQNNTIGIRYSWYSQGAVDNSTISDNNYGIVSQYYSAPIIRPYNDIFENQYGIWGDDTGTPHLGNHYQEGRNGIVNFLWDIKSSYSGTIYARYNWWGTDTPSPLVTANVDWSYYLTEDPNLAFQKVGEPLQIQSAGTPRPQSPTRTRWVCQSWTQRG